MPWPPAIPARVPGWERAFVAVMTEQLALPFGWSPDAHCLGTPALLCVGMTGVDPMHGFKRHSTEAAAWKQLFKLGFSDVEGALQAVFPEISPLLARRGDCGILDQEVEGRPSIATFVIMGSQAVGRSPRGPVYVPVGALRRCFAIGAP
ncbi:DUF6950 family protein [Devosia sediminis]|uniref:DUF6950 domain-containing protein n=1 Tax=Devosia sediminis TaxID=2798801 RepID=A0A934IWC7_9HYPH|nr:hypothetical protein [Devosia sediminis]MBJ3783425.1 hypothetical protein [Devosia sediminis]